MTPASTMSNGTTTPDPSDPYAEHLECCKILTKPSTAISTLNFVYSGFAFCLAVAFFIVLSREHKLIEYIQDAKPSDTLGFWLPPFMCIFVMVDTLIVGLGTFDYSNSCCLVNENVLHARYVVHAFIHPLIVVSTFEQTYVTFKRRSANFCCIKFDDGHRRSSRRCSSIMRMSAWLLGISMFGYNLGMNISLIYEPVRASQMRRFTTKSLINGASFEDVIEVVLLLVFLFYLSYEMWRYGTHFAYQMTTSWVNGWCIMFAGTLFILVSYLLPGALSVYAADLSILFFILTNFLVERMVLKDLYIAREIQASFDKMADEKFREELAAKVMEEGEAVKMEETEMVEHENPFFTPRGKDTDAGLDEELAAATESPIAVVMSPEDLSKGQEKNQEGEEVESEDGITPGKNEAPADDAPKVQADTDAGDQESVPATATAESNGEEIPSEKSESETSDQSVAPKEEEAPADEEGTPPTDSNDTAPEKSDSPPAGTDEEAAVVEEKQQQGTTADEAQDNAVVEEKSSAAEEGAESESAAPPAPSTRDTLPPSPPKDEE